MAGSFSCGRRGFYWRHGTGSEKKKAAQGHTCMVKIEQSNAVTEFDSTDLDTQFSLLQRTMIVLKRHELRWRATNMRNIVDRSVEALMIMYYFYLHFLFGGQLQASGVAVADDCVTTFNELKLKHSLKFIVYGMNDAMTEIQVLNLVLQLTFKVCLPT
jgi:hypothetical protein